MSSPSIQPKIKGTEIVELEVEGVKRTGERGFFFEVNLDTEAVRNVTKEVARKMVPLSLPFKDEKQIPEKLMQQLEEESKMLSGERP